jgi:hypothetical protein
MHNIKPLKTQLNPICHLLALLGAHHILHISRIRVKPSLFRYIKPIKRFMVRTHWRQPLYPQDRWIRILTKLWARWLAIQFLGLTPISSSPKVQTGYGAHTQPSMQLVLGVLFPGTKQWGTKLTTEFHIAPQLRASGAKPLLPTYATRHA